MKTFFKVVGFVLLIVFAFLVLCFLFLWGIDSCMIACEPRKTHQEHIKLCSKMNSAIPADTEVVYHIENEVVNFGPGSRFYYTIFRFEKEPTEWLTENNFENSAYEEKTGYFEKFFLDLIESKPNFIDEIPQQYLPKSDGLYYYLESDNVYFMYFPQNLSLYTLIPET